MHETLSQTASVPWQTACVLLLAVWSREVLVAPDNGKQGAGISVQGIVTQPLASEEQNLTLVLGKNKQCPHS